MESRLRKNHKLVKQASNGAAYLDTIITPSGDCIYFNIRICSNRPWYELYQEGQFHRSSYYDGEDFERAFNLYKEILLAFKGAGMAENANKMKDTFKRKADKLMDMDRSQRSNSMYDALKRQPLFLGINNF